MVERRGQGSLEVEGRGARGGMGVPVMCLTPRTSLFSLSVSRGALGGCRRGQ